MTKAIELAKEFGIAYYLTPEGTREMHGTDQQIEAFAGAMVDRAVPATNMRPIVDKKIYYIEETISALKKIQDTDCTEDVWETIQAAIEDLEQCIR